MGSNALSDQVVKPLLGELQARYDRHRFLDAWHASSDMWAPSTDLETLSVEELVFAGRLAVRLGGLRLSRSLFWKARKREPAHPLVRYFTNHLDEPRGLLLDELVAFEANPDLGGNNEELQASWLASHAYTWAKLRNKARANELMQQAHALFPGSAWLHSVESDILGFGDDWHASLTAAERAWELDSSSPWAATSLATALMNLEQVHEAMSRLEFAIKDTQSAQLVQTACWYQCAIAEAMEGAERNEALAKARELALRIEPMAPLSDREFKVGLAKTWLDIAQLAGDHEEMERWAGEARSPFHRQVLANLKANPSGRALRLSYRRAIQKHSECVPTSVSSALSATGIDVSVEELAADVTFGGTAEWAAADWLRNKGLHVRFFPATVETATRLIEAGIGFVVSWDDDESGHAVAIVGIDHVAGIAIAHDPTSFRSTEYLLRVFDPAASPLGVLGMAAVKPERARELDEMLPAEAELMEAAQAQQQALTLHGPSASSPVVTAIAARFPMHPGTQYLQAIQDAEEGRLGRALDAFRDLFNRYPNAPGVRIRLMLACRAMGDSALLRATLHSVVETGSVPGVESHSEWIRPHPRYVCELADMMRMSEETRNRAESMLRSVLRRNWAFASAWHVLADLRWERREFASALVAYSIASFLAPHNEHYARAYVDVLAQCHRTEEGFEWLEDRAREMGKSARGISTWISWIGVLEEKGYPERAIAACEDALRQHGDATPLLAFAVPFLARMGRWEEAGLQLRSLEASASKGEFHEAAVAFHSMGGQNAEALTHAEAWVDEAPRSMQARYAQLDLIASLNGQNAAAARAAEWMREHPANEDFEQAFCQHAQNSFHWRKIRVMRNRVMRNPEDGWAWRELAFSAITAFEMGDEKRRNRHRPRIEHDLAEIDRVAQGNSATIRAHALWMEANGNWRSAVDRYLEAIRCEPDHFYAYRRAWECSSRLSDQERRALWADIEPIYLDNSCHLPNALEMMRLLAKRFGPREAEQIVAGWRQRRPDDPNILEAAADLLLDHGHGRSDAIRALELLRASVDRFPYHTGLRFSLARACRVSSDSAGAKKAFEELVRRHPDNTSALTQLAWIEQREGETELALQILDRASRQEPQDTGPIETRAQILMESGRHEEAQSVLQDGLRQLPNSVGMIECAITQLMQCDRPEQAVEAARQGTRAFPRGAYLWLLLGKTLKDAPQFAAPREIESCLRRSLRLNRGLYESVDWLAMLLVDQHQYKQAADLLSEMESEMPDSSPALGRLAWIKRRGGEKQEAVADLAAVLRKAPWYTWGWNQLLTWLEEDENWASCRDLVDIVPAQMLTDLAFRQRRLLLLEKNKVALSSCASEWSELLSDFPEDVSLHLRRFDSLLEAGQPADAASVLRRVIPMAPENVYLLARLVRVECQEKKYSEALDHALMVCFAATEQSPWPVNQVWDQMRKAGVAQEFSQRLYARLREGARPTRRALVQYAEQILSRKGSPRAPKWIRLSPLNYATRQITRLLRLVEQSSWMESSYIADLMSALNHNGYERLVLSCWNRMRTKGLESNSDAWAQAGRAMVNQKKKRAGRELMQGWRKRTGIGMWVLANYLLCIPRLRRVDLEEVIATCRDALAELPHDHCARYLAYMEAEACALAGDKPGLTTVWDKYTRHFEGLPDKGEFFPKSLEYLVDDLPVAVRLAHQQDGRGFGSTRRRLFLKRFWSQKVRANGMRLFTLFIRVIVVLWLLGMGLAPLFK